MSVDNIVVRAATSDDAPSVASVDYTFSYTLEGAEVATTGGTNFVGETVSAETVVYGEDGTKYFITADEAPTMTLVDDANLLEVAVRVADTYSYTVNSNLGTTIATGTVVEGDTATVAYPRYINNEGTLYQKDVTNKEYRYGLVATSDNYVDTLEYTASDITNVVYYSEGEFIEGVTLTTKGNIPVRSSNALAAYATEDIVLTTLQPGVYDVYGVIYSNSSAGAKLSFALGENEFDFAIAGSASNWVSGNSGEITISEATDLTFLASGNEGAALDFIYVVKTGDYVAPAVPTEFDGTVEFVASYEESDTVEGNATALKATFNALGYSFNTLTFTVTIDDVVVANPTETLDTKVTGSSDVVYGLVIDGAIVTADAVTAVATLVE